jgi:DNA-binding NtrC family response regulator
MDLFKKDRLVLIVEDEPKLCELLRMCLTMEGVSCVTASTVQEAIAILDHKRVDLILLDWGLNGSQLDNSGGQVLRHSRKLDPMRPVLIMSGQDFDVRADALMETADGFIQKPVGLAVIKSYVRQWLNRLNGTPMDLFPTNVADVKNIEEVKLLYIRRAVEILGGNVSEAAQRLGVHRHTVTRILKGAA